MIDWFTIVAQLINFVILVWLLKRFLYKPVLKAINERENSIVKQITDTETARETATREHETYLQKNRDFEQQRKALLHEVKEEVSSIREGMMREMKDEIEESRSNLLKSLSNEQTHLNDEIIHRTAKEVFGIARQTLQELASKNLEEHIIEVFIERLSKQGAHGDEQMVTALKESSRNLTVTSAFKIPMAMRLKLKNTVEKLISNEVKIDFLVSPEQIGGIELTAHDHKISWSIADYLSSLEATVSEILNRNDLITGEKKGAV